MTTTRSQIRRQQQQRAVSFAPGSSSEQPMSAACVVHNKLDDCQVLTGRTVIILGRDAMAEEAEKKEDEAQAAADAASCPHIFILMTIAGLLLLVAWIAVECRRKRYF